MEFVRPVGVNTLVNIAYTCGVLISWMLSWEHGFICTATALWLSWQSACLVNRRSWVQIPAGPFCTCYFHLKKYVIGRSWLYPECSNVFTYPLGGGYVLFYTLFLTSLSLSPSLPPSLPPSLISSSLSLSLSLSLCHFLPSFWNNSATVREGVTKFEMPRQKLLNKCLFLFIVPFDL